MIDSLEDAGRVLRAVPGIGFSARALSMLPLLRTGCLSVLLTCETADTGWAHRFGAELVSTEELCRTRDDGDSRRDMGHLMDRLPDLVGARWQGRELSLASYLPLRTEWQPELDRLGVRVVAPPPLPVCEAQLDKTAMRNWFRHLGLPTPGSTVVRDLDPDRLRRRFGARFVVQQPYGSSGKGTYLVDLDRDDVLDRIEPGERWLVSEYAGDITLNYHGLLGSDGTPTVLRPSMQLTDVQGIGSAFGWYSGCDYRAPSHLAPGVLTRCHDLVERIGRGLAGLGYLGVFGVDLAVEGESVVVLEMNCRVQGSTWLLGEVELERAGLPAMLRHVLERRGLGTFSKPDFDPVDAAQLVVRHTAAPARLSAAPRSGRYHWEAGAVRRCGDGYGLLECGPDDSVLVGLARPGTVLQPGAPLGRVVSRRALATPDGRQLTDHGRLMVDTLNAMYTFEEAPC
ncbi:ATP-grasp domain-containing protein [Kitasatospora aureofaciens]|uniref:ATP-grasp domain-containing protein n=1 Tax=Kitasatospora aureofaciens TaxID=1894 RepID=UPI00380CC0C3